MARYINDAGTPTNTGTNWTVNAASTLYAGWARNCSAGTGANCSLTVGQTSIQPALDALCWALHRAAGVCPGKT